MIIVLKPRATHDDLTRVEHMIKRRGLDTHIVEGSEMTIIGCIGDTTRIESGRAPGRERVYPSV